MITYESFEVLLNLLQSMETECNTINKGMEHILGEDTCVMYFKPLNLVENYFIDVLQSEFNETKEGAEWFVYEGLAQINNGGTEIDDDSKEWHIHTVKDYYDYLCSLKK